ncbi:MAG: phosphoglucosamine mutase [Elusimicrobia bacterium CG06_land_8_20_14_3_00_38_11]|nr:MAG: phosphoglucosamine mutase [Elusimicrobia bacterium CG06_land_8_20_14_3_00_38_11]
MKKLFGTDGIRGIAGKYPLEADFIKKIGSAAAAIINDSSKKEFILGCDTRESSSWISKALCDGITAAGVDVFDCGVFPTPAVAYITTIRGSSAGCVISASHNSAEFNGIKFFSNEGIKISDDKELEIEKLTLSKNFNKSEKPAGKYEVSDNYADDIYTKFLYSTLPRDFDLSGLKIVLDCANGANYKIAPEVFSHLKAEIITLSVSPDGKNINKNCGSLHLKNLRNAVVENNADFGLAFDGDGDRCIFVDETGEIRDGDCLIAIAADELNKKGELKNNSVVATVMANFGFNIAMERDGIKIISSAVGDKYVHDEMIKNDVILGGEQSGHIIFRNFLNTGDGLLTSIQISAIIKKSKKSLSQLSETMKKYPQILLNVKVEKKIPIAENKKLSDVIKSVEKKLNGNGRVLVRYSGTEPLLRIMVEGPGEKVINQYAQEIAATINF